MILSKMASREVNYLAEPGDVLVGDAGGMTDMSSMGGQSFVSAKARGLEGVVIDGAVRDVGEIRKYGVPTWCRGVTPKTGKMPYRSDGDQWTGCPEPHSN